MSEVNTIVSYAKAISDLLLPKTPTNSHYVQKQTSSIITRLLQKDGESGKFRTHHEREIKRASVINDE